MTEKLELYKCSICGNLVQVLLSGVGELVCCNQPMEKLCPKINEDNELSEKHIPVIELENDKKFVPKMGTNFFNGDDGGIRFRCI